MSSGLIAFVGLVYTVIAIEQCWKQNYAMGIVFFGYAFSNIGLYWRAE